MFVFAQFGKEICAPDRAGERPSNGQIARSVTRELIETPLLTALMLLAVRLVSGTFRVEGSSMEPTLHHGQRIIVDKFTYGWLHPPRRGDIIVLRDPHTLGREVIKRVIGLPGERVEINQGQLYINSQPLNDTYITSPSAHTWGPNTVLPGHYFVLGDNRDYSKDSLTWGWLPGKHIIGKVWLWH
jgi:signal peptidase I